MRWTVLYTFVVLPVLLLAAMMLWHVVRLLVSRRAGSWRQWLNTFAVLFFFCAIANFFVFFLASNFFGGSAVKGKIEAGQYYLRITGNTYHLVSSNLFHAMYWYEKATFFGMALSVAAAFLVALSNRSAAHLGPREMA